MKLNFNQNIFRDYDIRGVYPNDLNEDSFYIIGQSLARYFNAEEIAVGRDTRLSSPALFKALTEGITSLGVNVVDLGLISTEINYFASGFYRFPASVIVSASHNPPQYNGLKIVKAGVVPLHGSYGLPEIKLLAVKNQFEPARTKGKLRKFSVMDDWIKHLLSLIDLKSIKPLKVVIDAANGMGGITWNALIPHLPLDVIPLYFEPDGHFPNHLPDPLVSKNLEDLKKQVRAKSADLGFAIDGDADRLFVVDDKCELVSGSLTTAMLAEHLLEKYPKSPVLYSVTCSKIVPETIKNSGGVPLKTRVGHSYIKTEMRKHNAVFAGEHSGHFYFRDNFFADSSSLAGLLFLQYLSGKRQKLSELRKKFDKYSSSGEINFIIDEKEKILHNLYDKYKGSRTDETDGLTIEFDDWWFNIRLSKTEPLLRLNLEAGNRDLLRQKLQELESLLESYGANKKID